MLYSDEEPGWVQLEVSIGKSDIWALITATGDPALCSAAHTELTIAL